MSLFAAAKNGIQTENLLTPATPAEELKRMDHSLFGLASLLVQQLSKFPLSTAIATARKNLKDHIFQILKILNQKVPDIQAFLLSVIVCNHKTVPVWANTGLSL
jgi:hypothetical protein